jgi:hypothetical protein
MVRGFTIRLLAPALFCVSVCAGCSAPWSPRDTESLSISHTASDTLPALPLPAQAPAEASNETAQVATATVPVVEPLSPDQELALSNIIELSRDSMTLDAAAESQLRNELRQSRPEEWPLVVKQFRSAHAYRAELLAREARRGQELNRVSHTTHLPPTEPSPPQSQAMVTPKLQTSAIASDEIQLVNHVEPVQTNHAAEPTRNTAIANRTTEALATPLPTSPVMRTSHEQPVVANLDWEVQLDAAIDAMQQQVKSQPGTTDEMQQHMRLKMMQLMAGRENDSLSPIPGASPTEQDYWSKQLFALTTYFDTSRQPDAKQRAAGTLVHLDQARAKLSELAALQIRNLTFVDSVDGFGLYKPHESTKFKPNEQITLYAEVDNFRSESTKDGYRTKLGTSYEIVDPTGRRVDGAQFQDVEDICRSERHDYHMRYDLALPERIYPGTYELRLIITDQLSNKIGQSSLSFEIAE